MKHSGALLADTKLFFSHWHNQDTEDMQIYWQSNLFAKSSRFRSKAILRVLKQRYLQELNVALALAELVKNSCPANVLDKILYFHTAGFDRLIFDVVIEFLYPRYRQGRRDVQVSDLTAQLIQWTSNTWSAATTTRLSQGILAALRDFGILTGKSRKQIIFPYLPVYAFAYIAFYLKQLQPSVRKLMELSDWQLFFLKPIEVEKQLFEAHQQGILEYHVAGSVTRLTFPVPTLPEYATFLAQR
ncbi:hypothetical protein GlitD10_0303 [Gloeomargarita lithophora Alchichica-D10]|uniref:Uncharacterized protein n=2 Tax=Gloeomargarita TaxID=1188227 RepID=A0A1J0A9J5_9CYAN|nr:hypothetical protein GlitD10_0303 [Gloeomargarita lithophora Alchichica-D10]